MSIQVIGAGFGRTGTQSLQIALEKLGFGPCYHNESLLRNPEDIVHWKAAYKHKKVNWQELFKNHRAVVDFPGSMYYQELADIYPEAKVILTTRDPEKWYQSVRSTITGFDQGISTKLRLLLSAAYSKKSRNLLQVLAHNDKAVWEKYFKGRFMDKAWAIKKYEAHIEEVKNAIPKERLLVLELGEGWKPLCNFLGMPVPEEPYPKSNKKENFAKWTVGIIKETL